jgi:hypothetical protein
MSIHRILISSALFAALGFGADTAVSVAKIGGESAGCSSTHLSDLSACVATFGTSNGAAISSTWQAAPQDWIAVLSVARHLGSNVNVRTTADVTYQNEFAGISGSNHGVTGHAQDRALAG